MACIKSLDQNTVHRICSGQVVINLANAVKELIENSLDAGAKTIEIRLRQYGSELIEVIDDGPGIAEQDFQTITLKHYTSKIQNYDDLETLGTFGFRGEALSSLCALSDLTITTRHASTDVATRLEYDKKGLIAKRTPCARSVGTSVCLERLFHTLPVRHKEFTKNLKREYHKLIHVIQCYSLISEGVKLSCYNIVGDKSTKIMSTHSKNSLKENIIEIFGVAAMSSLVKFEQIEPSDEVLIDYKLKKPDDVEQKAAAAATTTDYASLFKIEGYVSDCSHNSGRSAPDRQYFYVNKRPCDNSRVTKLVNELFHQFNRLQYPMFVLNVIMNSHDVDVNVTPDKLQMFIKSENILFAILKTTLLKQFNQSYQNVSVEGASLNSSGGGKGSSSQLINSFFTPLGTKKRTDTANESSLLIFGKRDMEEKENGPIRNKRAAEDDSSNSSPTTKKFQVNDSPAKQKQPMFTMYSRTTTMSPKNSPAKVIENPLKLFQTRIGSNIRVDDQLNASLNDSVAERIDLHLCNYKATASPTPTPTLRMHESLKQLGYRGNQNDHTLDAYDPDVSSSSTLLIDQSTSSVLSSSIDSTPNSQVVQSTRMERGKIQRSESTDDPGPSLQIERGKIQRSESTDDPGSSLNSDDVPITSSVDFAATRKSKTLKVNLKDYLKQQTERLERLKLARSSQNEERDLLSSMKFRTKNLDSKDAEAELDRSITKEDFLRMRVRGQFNKGFIIAQLNSDLFIVDQHAADEIYNFEMLQRTGKIEKQRLLQPIYLELTASAEAVLLDNIGLVEKAGFEVQVCSNRKVGNRIMVTCVPISNKSNKLFNTRDIDELVFILSENELNAGSISSSSCEQDHLTNIRPSSLRALYASKACRKSVMIGDSLNQKEMRRIVTHLSEIDKPWNCPHGRPTLRHLINVDLLKTLKS